MSRTGGSLSARRAWIEIKYVVKDSDFAGSLSARRAWIEMLTDDVSTGGKIVALRKESVDRNAKWFCDALKHLWSLSARRAWIEIRYSRYCRYWLGSLSARRAWIEILAYPDMIICTNGRSPQGERG